MVLIILYSGGKCGKVRRRVVESIDLSDEPFNKNDHFDLSV